MNTHITNRLQIKANNLPIQESGLGTLGSLEDLVGNWKKVQTFSDFVIQVLDFFFFRWVTFVTSIPNWTRWRTWELDFLDHYKIFLINTFFINQVSFSRKLLVGQNKVKPALLLLPLSLQKGSYWIRETAHFLSEHLVVNYLSSIVKLCML